VPNNKKLSPQSIIIVGGEGTRLQPLTFKTPKPLLHIGGKKIIEYQIDKLKETNVNLCALATGYKAQMFKNYFKNGSMFGIYIKYAYEEQPLGTGGAIRNAYNALPYADPETPVIIWNGDIISNINLEKMLSKFYTTKSDLMMYLTPVENPRMYGLVELGENNKIVKFIEKPQGKTKLKTNMINAGCYIIKRKLIEEFFPDNQNISVEKEIFPTLIKTSIKTYGYVDESLWADIGTPEKYLETNMLAAENKIRGITMNEENYYIQNKQNSINILSTTSEIHPEATILNSMIESGVKIGANTVISDSYISKNTHIGDNTVIEKAIIGEGAYIGPDNELPASVRINHHTRIEKQAIRFTSLKCAK
jgi:mannose-1-phosphate guanylyltransferase